MYFKTQSLSCQFRLQCSTISYASFPFYLEFQSRRIMMHIKQTWRRTGCSIILGKFNCSCSIILHPRASLRKVQNTVHNTYLVFGFDHSVGKSLKMSQMNFHVKYYYNLFSFNYLNFGAQIGENAFLFSMLILIGPNGNFFDFLCYFPTL